MGFRVVVLGVMIRVGWLKENGGRKTVSEVPLTTGGKMVVYVYRCTCGKFGQYIHTYISTSIHQ